jgi:hypothetical protein
MNRIHLPDTQRIYLLLRQLLFLKRHAIVYISLALIGVLTIISAMDAATGIRPQFYQGSFLPVLYFCGMILTGRTFRDIHDPIKGPAFLLLPASNLEKFISRLAAATIVYAIGMTLLYTILSLISEGLNLLLFGVRHPLFNPLDSGILIGCAVFFVIQAPFLLGAIYFKKHTLSKTILSVCIYIIMLLLVCLLGVKLFFGGYTDGFSPALDLVNRLQAFSFTRISSRLDQIVTIAKWALYIGFWGLIAPLCWIIAYYRLKETEA